MIVPSNSLAAAIGALTAFLHTTTAWPLHHLANTFGVRKTSDGCWDIIVQLPPGNRADIPEKWDGHPIIVTEQEKPLNKVITLTETRFVLSAISPGAAIPAITLFRSLDGAKKAASDAILGKLRGTYGGATRAVITDTSTESREDGAVILTVKYQHSPGARTTSDATYLIQCRPVGD
jgi:hypothetical protein